MFHSVHRWSYNKKTFWANQFFSGLPSILLPLYWQQNGYIVILQTYDFYPQKSWDQNLQSISPSFTPCVLLFDLYPYALLGMDTTPLFVFNAGL